MSLDCLGRFSRGSVLSKVAIKSQMEAMFHQSHSSVTGKYGITDHYRIYNCYHFSTKNLRTAQ